MFQWILNFLKKKGRYTLIKDRDQKESYLERYYIWHHTDDSTPENNTKRKYKYNAFLHHFLRSDDPVNHDHPWPWFRFILTVGYWEHYKDGSVKWCPPFSFAFRKATDFHWVELVPGTRPWTLFVHGERCRLWGFFDDETKTWIAHHEYDVKRAQKNA